MHVAQSGASFGDSICPDVQGTSTRLGLTLNSEPAREGRTFPITGPLNGP